MHQSLGAAVGAHKPLRSYKINFQEAKTTREERTHSGAVDLRRIHYRHRSLLVPGPLPEASVYTLRPRAREGQI